MLRLFHRSALSRPLRGGLAALLLSAFLLSLHPPAASAAASLTASENPVVIPWSATDKQTTISWNTDNGHKARVTVATNGGQPSEFFKGDGQGSKPFTATFGSAYKFRLYDNQTDQQLATLDVTTKRPATLTAKPRNQITDLGCQVQCITSVDIAPHGTYASVHIKTNEPAKLGVKVSTQAPDGNGNFGSLSANPNTTLGDDYTDYMMNVLPLQPNSFYHYVVTATDHNGKKAWTHGTFTTLKRVVGLHFTSIYVIDDSDGLTGAGDLKVGFRVNHEPWAHYNDAFADTGETLNPRIHVSPGSASEQIDLLVVACDNDGVGQPSFMHWPATGEPDYNGAPCDWARGAHTVYLETGLGETYEREFSFYVNPLPDSGSDLRLKVSGKVVVSYQ